MTHSRSDQDDTAVGPAGKSAHGHWLLLAALVFGGCDDPVVVLDPAGGGSLVMVADGLDQPVFLTAHPADAGRVYIVEKPGRIRLMNAGVLQSAPFLDIADLVSDGGERGLLSVAFHPDYLSNGFFFVNYTNNVGDTRIVRYTVESTLDEANHASAQILLTVGQPFGNHNGGQIAFGPDGMLYIGMGDGGSGGDPQGHGQNPATLLGALLRIDVDGASPYAVPADNPFVGSPNAAAEVWAYGLRNPWRFSFDRQTGGLYIADVGQNAVEEVSYQPTGSLGGENYGWNTMEGSQCFGSNDCDPSGLVLPVHEYGHGEGCSITGGYVYRGRSAPAFQGRYFFADFCSPWIRSFRLEGGEATELFDHTADFGPVDGVASFGQDALGELYVLTLSGQVYRIAEPE